LPVNEVIEKALFKIVAVFQEFAVRGRKYVASVVVRQAILSSNQAFITANGAIHSGKKTAGIFLPVLAALFSAEGIAVALVDWCTGQAKEKGVG
jgi:hypothetical protein